MGVKSQGKNGIEAEVVQYSVNKNNPDSRIITFNVKYGLVVHAEALRHRLFSRGVKSNRAIPMNKIRSEVLSDPYIPVWFGSKQKGMVADNEMKWKGFGRWLWKVARYPACFTHYLAEKAGAHKEWANRLLNPWQFVRETITFTEGDNFYNLRIHKDAQKDIYELAKCMYSAHLNSLPSELHSGEWHVPYVKRERVDGALKYFDNDGSELTVEQALQCSAARCARSSYDNHDKKAALYDTDKVLYNQLIEDEPKHASPVEHQAKPMDHADINNDEGLLKLLEQEGVTHLDKNGHLWSGNFKGWIQHRQLIPDNACWEYKY